MSSTDKLWTKDYIFLLAAVVFAAFTHNAFTVVFPVYILDIGGDNALTGFMLTGLMVAGIFTRLIFGPLIDRIGRKKILVIGSVAFALNTIAYCFVTDLSVLFALRVFNGVSQGIFFPVPPTLVADISPKNRLVDAMGYFGIASSIGASLAPTVGLGLYEAVSPLAFFVVTSVFAVISVGFTLLIKEKYRVPQKAKPPAGSGRLPRLPKIANIIELSILLPSFLTFLLALGNSSIQNFLATCGIHRNIADISIFFLLNNIVMILTRLCTGKITKKLGSLRTILIGCALVLASTLIIAFAYHLIAIIIASILFGIGFSLATQLVQVIILRMVKAERRGVANSTHMLLSDIGLGIGAAIWGLTSNGGGYTLTYLLSAAVVAAAALLHLFYIMPKYKKLQSETE